MSNSRFLRVDLVSGAALGLLDQQVVPDGGGNPVGEGEFHRNLCLGFARPRFAAAFLQLW